MMNAAVFPEPVTAPPTMSFPASATGIVLDWIGVGEVKPISAKPFKIGRERDIA